MNMDIKERAGQMWPSETVPVDLFDHRQIARHGRPVVSLRGIKGIVFP